MPINKLQDFELGAVDGKHEYVDMPSGQIPKYETFLVPQTVNERALLSGEKYLIRGFRGTGKTSLLRWLAKQHRDSGAQGQFVLFKSDLTASERMEMSKQTGIIWEAIASDKMEVLQDFKESWKWFLHHKIAEILIEQSGPHEKNTEFKKYRQLLGLSETSWFERVTGKFPKIEAAKIRIKANLEVIAAEFSGDIHSGGGRSIDFATVLKKLDSLLRKVPIETPMYLCLDGLEVFYETDDQYKRDLRMVRDLIFAVSSFSNFLKSHSIPVKLYAAIRSEVLDAIGSDGQEVSRLVSDCGFNIAWHFANRSLKHPLLNMLRRKIWYSEAMLGLDYSPDPIDQYFPSEVNGTPLDVFLLDQSFYKPRDLILRLKVAQEQFPINATFDSVVLTKTDIDYSAKMWEEVTYELSAMYNSEEVKVIEGLFLGYEPSFDAEDVAQRLRFAASTTKAADDIMRRRGPKQVLRDLYRLGAIGNSFRSGHSQRQRWVHRGDARLVENQRMVVHPALMKTLETAVRSRHFRKSPDFSNVAQDAGWGWNRREVWGKGGMLDEGRSNVRMKRR